MAPRRTHIIVKCNHLEVPGQFRDRRRALDHDAFFPVTARRHVALLWVEADDLLLVGEIVPSDLFSSDPDGTVLSTLYMRGRTERTMETETSGSLARVARDATAASAGQECARPVNRR